jgi:hypothetical protein
MTEKIVNPAYPTICIAHRHNHFWSLLPTSDGTKNNDPNNNNPLLSSPSYQNTSETSTKMLQQLPATLPIQVNSSPEKYDFSYMNHCEIDRLCQHMRGMSEEGLKELYSTLSAKLVKQNGWVVDITIELSLQYWDVTQIHCFWDLQSRQKWQHITSVPT